ncbi:MAG: hypothetical protein ACLFNU_11010 [Bacteroidales bacterium]
MRKLVAYTVRIMLVAERLTKRDYGKELFLLTFYVLSMYISAIFGSIIFLTVRLGYFDPIYARTKIAPFAISIMLLTPIIVILYFRRKVNVEQIRERTNRMDFAELKRERTKGVVFVMISSSSILIALTILYTLTVLNLI